MLDPRRRPRLIRARVAAALVAVLVVLAAGCAPAPSLLNDPREILAAAVTRFRAARSVHLVATIDGSVRLDALVPGLPFGGSGGGSAGGSGTGAGRLALTGTTASADLDLANGRSSGHAEVPALFGLTADVRDVGGRLYLRSTLTAPGWHVVDAPTAAGLPPLRLTAWLDRLMTWLAAPDVVPARLDDAPCPAGTCYVVRLRTDATTLRPSDLPASPGLLRGVAATVTLDLRIDRVTLRPSEVLVGVELGDAGEASATIGLSAWDATVTVEAPSPGEIVEGPLLP